MTKILSTLFATLFFITQNFSYAFAATQLWETKLEDKMSWSQITYFGTLLLGSKTSLASYNPQTGELMWKRDDLNKVAPFDVQEISEFPIIVTSQDKGIGGQKSKLEALSMVDGKTIWSTEEMPAFPLGIYAIPEKRLVLLFSKTYSGGEEGNGVFMSAYNIETGEVAWKTEYRDNANEVPTYLADNAGAFYVRNDYSGHQSPLVEGDNIYIPFGGIDCFDLNTGTKKWSVKFKAGHKTLKKAYAPLIIDGETVYGTGGGVVYAVNKETGDIKWQSEKVSSGLIAQLVVADDMVLARLGGNFFDQGGKQFKLDKPLGMIAYNKSSGATLWEYKGARGGITNFVHLPQLKTVMFADIASLIGIDTQSTGKVKETFKLPLEFKRSIGTTEVASAGVKALTGGIGGMLQAGAKLAVGKERQDPPVVVTTLENGTLVVRGMQHLLAFDPAKQEISWSNYFAAPAHNGFAMLVMSAITVVSAAYNQVSYASGQTSMSTATDRINQAFANMDKYLDRRFNKTQSNEKYSYILTNVEDGGDKGTGILAIDLTTGEPAGQVIFDDKNPEYIIDNLGEQVYYFKGKNTIKAYSLTNQ